MIFFFFFSVWKKDINAVFLATVEWVLTHSFQADLDYESYSNNELIYLKSKLFSMLWSFGALVFS